MLNKFKVLLNRKKMNRELEVNDITKEQIEKYIEKGAILIDVRSPQEYKEGHLEKSISIPDYEIMSKIDKIINDKNQEIIVYCSSGHRSKKVQKKLESLGYEKVYNLYNGLENYCDF